MSQRWDPILYCYVEHKIHKPQHNPWKVWENLSQKLAVYSVGTALILGTAELIATYGNYFL